MKRLSSGLDRIGAGGSLLAAAACPLCFPKLAALGALFGLGALAPLEGYFFWGAQALVLLALAGQVMAFRRRANRPLLLFALLSSVLFFLSLYLLVSELLSYLALGGIALASLWLMVTERRQAVCPIETRAGGADE